MKRLLRENGLSLVLLFMFAITWIGGQAVAGLHVANEERMDHGLPPQEMREYLMSAHFLEATAENWESEFLQMGVSVALTVFLFQKGSAESKNPEHPSLVDEDPRLAPARLSAPWPVRRGGWVLAVYEHSLTLAFLLLFAGAFTLHVIAGRENYNVDRLREGQHALTRMEYLGSSRFWFESLQNWQSEFLAILAMVVLSIFLRQRGSPESKPVATPHWETED
jgi:hypothetical protein